MPQHVRTGATPRAGESFSHVGGRTWWAHLTISPINAGRIILRNQIEERLKSGRFAGGLGGIMPQPHGAPVSERSWKRQEGSGRLSASRGWRAQRSTGRKVRQVAGRSRNAPQRRRIRRRVARSRARSTSRWRSAAPTAPSQWPARCRRATTALPRVGASADHERRRVPVASSRWSRANSSSSADAARSAAAAGPCRSRCRSASARWYGCARHPAASGPPDAAGPPAGCDRTQSE